MPIFDDNTPKSLHGLSTPLLEWYGRCKREMPWRDSDNSYYIWVSEIMLQQTRVEAVRAYFARFITALPTVRDLADCDEDALLKLWEGLGYYNRVRNLQKAARIVARDFGGVLPADYGALLALPGVGEYTAGAVASIAYGIAMPCVDGNVMRVLSRVTANAADITLPAVKRAYQALVQTLLDELSQQPAPETDRRRSIGDFNQSLMELGATVCVPNGTPLCGSCPLHERCAAHRAGNPGDYPVKTAKAQRRIERRTVLVLLCGDRVLLRRRPESGLLAGLWELPNREGWETRAELEESLAGMSLVASSVHSLKKAKHIFSHIEWRMQGYLIYLDEARPVEGCEWVRLCDLRERYALPNAFQAYSTELERWAKM